MLVDLAVNLYLGRLQTSWYDWLIDWLIDWLVEPVERCRSRRGRRRCRDGCRGECDDEAAEAVDCRADTGRESPLQTPPPSSSPSSSSSSLLLSSSATKALFQRYYHLALPAVTSSVNKKIIFMSCERYASAIYAGAAVCLSVCLSVRLSHTRAQTAERINFF